MALRQTRVDVDAQQFVLGATSAINDMIRRAEAKVDRVGEDMARRSQDLVPVDEQHLKDSMTTRSNRTRVQVLKAGGTRGGNYYFELRYSDPAAWYQELGTKDHDPQPFVRPARQQAARDLAAW